MITMLWMKILQPSTGDRNESDIGKFVRTGEIAETGSGILNKTIIWPEVLNRQQQERKNKKEVHHV
jgi:hypothetical protein